MVCALYHSLLQSPKGTSRLPTPKPEIIWPPTLGRHLPGLVPGGYHGPREAPLAVSPALATHHLPLNFHATGTRLVSAFCENNSGLGHFILHWLHKLLGRRVQPSCHTRVLTSPSQRNGSRGKPKERGRAGFDKKKKLFFFLIIIQSLL